MRKLATGLPIAETGKAQAFADAGSRVEIIERANNGWKLKSGGRYGDPKALRRQINLLYTFSHVAKNIRKHLCCRSQTLGTGLAGSFSGPNGSQIVLQTTFDCVLET